MGMFDYIKIDSSIKIPLNKELRSLKVNPHEFDFQTKDLDNLLISYEIKKNKRLYKDKKPTRYHGEIIFGTFYDTETTDYFIDYKAKFTEGVLQSIKLISCNSSCNKKRKENSIKIQEKLEKRQKTFRYKICSFFRKKIGISINFHHPKISFYKKDYFFTKYGISLSELNTELIFGKNKSNWVISFKVLGFGFSVRNKINFNLCCFFQK